MKKRLRKKLRLGEFQELGFELDMKLRDGMSKAEFLEFWDRSVDIVDREGLGMGGGGTPPDYSIFLTRAGRGTVTEAQRASVTAAFAADPDVLACDAKALRDAWYGWD